MYSKAFQAEGVDDELKQRTFSPRFLVGSIDQQFRFRFLCQHQHNIGIFQTSLIPLDLWDTLKSSRAFSSYHHTRASRPEYFFEERPKTENKQQNLENETTQLHPTSVQCMGIFHSLFLCIRNSNSSHYHHQSKTKLPLSPEMISHPFPLLPKSRTPTPSSTPTPTPPRRPPKATTIQSKFSKRTYEDLESGRGISHLSQSPSSTSTNDIPSPDMGGRKLRKVMRVEGDWEVVRDGDWEGFSVELGMVGRGETNLSWAGSGISPYGSLGGAGGGIACDRGGFWRE